MSQMFSQKSRWRYWVCHGERFLSNQKCFSYFYSFLEKKNWKFTKENQITKNKIYFEVNPQGMNSLEGFPFVTIRKLSLIWMAEKLILFCCHYTSLCLFILSICLSIFLTFLSCIILLCVSLFCLSVFLSS